MDRDGSYDEVKESRFPISSQGTKDQWSDQRDGDMWDPSIHGDNADDFTNVIAENESLVEQDTLEKAWNWSVEASSWVWDKVEPILIDHLPEEKNPLWVFGIFVFVVFAMLAGFVLNPSCV